MPANPKRRIGRGWCWFVPISTSRGAATRPAVPLGRSTARVGRSEICFAAVMHKNELNKQREAAIWFRREADENMSLTKLGGLPTLPLGIEWPRQHQSGSPLHFLAQVDLSRLPSTPLNGASNAPTLPKSGLLFFFADMVEEMLWNDNGGPFATTRVIFADQTGSERAPPHDLPEVLHSFGEHAGGYKTGISVYPRAVHLHGVDMPMKRIDALAAQQIATPRRPGRLHWFSDGALVIR
jgi:hypothetical protein